MNKLVTICRWIVGLLFIISGLIKANDPTGFGIKMHEYFQVFSMDVFIPYAIPFAMIVCVLEVVLGFAVLFSINANMSSWLLLLTIVFFTWLTGYSAITNKVTDCGCFGDAIKLTPWQSFQKDIVLFALILIIFVYRNKLTSSLPRLRRIFLVNLVLFGTLLFSLYCYNYLPVKDFLQYKVGVDIVKNMKNSEPLKFDYVYSKDGKQFHYDDIMKAPYNDPSYKYDTAIVLNPEAGPKIVDYRISTLDGEDITEQSLQDKRLFIVMYDLNLAAVKYMEHIFKLSEEISSLNIEPVILTASGNSEIEEFQRKFNNKYKVVFGDGTLLKSMVRANPGLLLLNNGVIKGKWHYHSIPNEQEIRDVI